MKTPISPSILLSFTIPILFLSKQSLGTPKNSTNVSFYGATRIADCRSARLIGVDVAVYRQTTSAMTGHIVVSPHIGGPISRKILSVDLKIDERFILITPHLRNIHPFQINLSPNNSVAQSQYSEEGAEFGPEPLQCFLTQIEAAK